MRTLVNEFNALNEEGKQVSDLIDDSIVPLVKALLANDYSAREVLGLIVQSADLAVSTEVLSTSLRKLRHERKSK